MRPDNNLEKDFNSTENITVGVKQKEDLSSDDIEHKDRQNAYFLRASFSKLLKTLLESKWVFWCGELLICSICLYIILTLGYATVFLINDRVILFNFLTNAGLVALIMMSSQFVQSFFTKK